MNRRELIAAVPALASGLGFASGASAASPDSSPVGASSSPAHEAWLRYRDTLQKQREEMLKDPLCQDPTVRAQGLYLLQSMEAVAFNMCVAPRQQYPALYVQSIYMPFELSWGYPSPDISYHDGIVDGAHTYRIYGNKGRTYWAMLQIVKSMWGEEVGDLGFVELDDVPTKPNGDFEFFLGPNPPAQPDGKYWFKLDPKLHNIWLLLREVFYDWKLHTPMDLHIECLDRDPGAPITFDEKELAARIERARRLTEGNVEMMQWTLGQCKRDPKDSKAGNETIVRNRFATMDAGASAYTANPIAHYVVMIYDVKPDEALIIEMPVVPARFWTMGTASVWQQAADGFYHQSSINGMQARLDVDGRFRAVLALQDPGVPNWLDPVGVGVGMVSLKWYKSQGFTVPTVTQIKLADVRRHLPKDTPVVTPEQRRVELDVRRVVSLRRYGE